MKSKQSRKFLMLTAMMCGISNVYVMGMEDKMESIIEYVKSVDGIENDRIMRHLYDNNKRLALPISEKDNLNEHARVIIECPKIMDRVMNENENNRIMQYLYNKHYSKKKDALALPDKEYLKNYLMNYKKSLFYNSICGRIVSKAEILDLLEKSYKDPRYPSKECPRYDVRSILTFYCIPTASIFDKDEKASHYNGICLFRDPFKEVEIGVIDRVNHQWICTSYDEYVRQHKNFQSPLVCISKTNCFCSSPSCPFSSSSHSYYYSPVYWMLYVGMHRGDTGNPGKLDDCINGVKKYLNRKDLNYCCCRYYYWCENGMHLDFYKPNFDQIIKKKENEHGTKCTDKVPLDKICYLRSACAKEKVDIRDKINELFSGNDKGEKVTWENVYGDKKIRGLDYRLK